MKMWINKLIQPPKFLYGIFTEGDRVGLDIGAHSVKVVKVLHRPKETVLEQALYQEMTPAPDTKSADPDDRVVRTITDIWHKAHLKDRNVRLVLSDPGIYVRHISIPRLDDQDLGKGIRWQAEKYVPFPIEEAITDYQVIQEKSVHDPAQMEVALVAVERKVINRYLNILKMAKLNATLIDIAPFSAARAVMRDPQLKDSQLTVLLDVGHLSTNIIFIQGKNLRLVKTLDIGGQNLTQAISESLVIDRLEAEKRKKELGWTNVGETTDGYSVAVTAILQDLVKNIERLFAYSERDYMADGVGRVVLCGGGSQLKGLQDHLAKFFQVPVDLFCDYPYLATSINANRIQMMPPSPLMAAALGAAL